MRTLTLRGKYRWNGWVWCLLMILATPPAMAVNTLPVASNDSSQILEPLESVDIELTATDADADPLEYIITALPTKGTLTVDSITLASTNLPYTIESNDKTVTYTALATGHGTDTFKFKANDGTGDSSLATVTVVINREPGASTDSLTTPPSTDLKTTFPAVDPDDDEMTFVVTTLPGHGQLKIGSTTLSDGDIPYTTETANIVYTPDPSFHGEDHFYFKAADTWSTSELLMASIQVNTTPVPETIAVTVLPNGLATIQFVATDADRDPVTYILVSLPVHGGLDVDGIRVEESDLPKELTAGITTIRYVVDAEYLGTDSFHYRVSDGIVQSARSIVTIAVNTPPTVTDSVLVAVQDQTASGVLTPVDPDGDTLTIRLASLPEHGSLTIAGKAITVTGADLALSSGRLAYTYKPTAEYVGTDVFTYQASDGKSVSTTATVAVTVSLTDTTASDDDGNVDGTESDEQVLSETTEPANVPVGCAPIGLAEVLLSVLCLTAVCCGRQLSK